MKAQVSRDPAKGWIRGWELRLVAMGPEKLLLRQMASRGKGEAAARPELAPLLSGLLLRLSTSFLNSFHKWSH